jgi:hypothetical protein
MRTRSGLVAAIILATTIIGCGNPSNHNVAKDIKITVQSDRKFAATGELEIGDNNPVSCNSGPMATANAVTGTTVEACDLNFGPITQSNVIVSATASAACENGYTLKVENLNVNLARDGRKVRFVFDDDRCLISPEGVTTPTHNDPDGDGLEGLDDECPMDATNTCNDPKDTDGDGIIDDNDECPFDDQNLCRVPDYNYGALNVQVKKQDSLSASPTALTGATVEVNNLAVGVDNCMTDVTGRCSFSDLTVDLSTTITVRFTGYQSASVTVIIPAVVGSWSAQFILTPDLPANGMVFDPGSWFCVVNEQVDVSNFLMATDGNGAISGSYVGSETYSSDATTVVTVLPNTGVATCVAVGTANITAVDGASSATITLGVHN